MAGYSTMIYKGFFWIFNRVQQIRKRGWQLRTTIEQEIKGRFCRQIYYITDTANWSFKWDAHYIAKGLENRVHSKVPIITAPWHLRHQTLLFGNRYTYFFGPRSSIHPSNNLFLIWFHGDPEDPSPDLKKMFRQLPEALDPVKKVVVTCDISRRVLLAQGILQEKIVTIPLGVDLAFFKPTTLERVQPLRDRFGIPKGAFCIGSFQKDGLGWEEGDEPKLVKGPDIFLKAMGQIYKKHPNVMVFLTGPSRGYVKKGLKRLGIPFVHHFLQEYQDIVACYQALDLYMIASRSEGGPKALLESWACGVPLVSTRMGMPADCIQSGVNGFLAPIEDWSCLAEHTISLIEDPNLAQQCRVGGLNSVVRFDWKNVADAYYDMILSSVNKID